MPSLGVRSPCKKRSSDFLNQSQVLRQSILGNVCLIKSRFNVLTIIGSARRFAEILKFRSEFGYLLNIPVSFAFEEVE